MRTFIVGLILSLIVFGSCQNDKSSNENEINSDLINNPATAANGKVEKDKMPVIQFKEIEHDFGKLIDGEKVSFSFKFTNVGKGNLIIVNVIPSCGCTVPKFPDHPIKPGESNYIDIKFDSKNRPGNFIKDVKVHTNTIPNTHLLYIKGFVEKNK